MSEQDRADQTQTQSVVSVVGRSGLKKERGNSPGDHQSQTSGSGQRWVIE